METESQAYKSIVALFLRANEKKNANEKMLIFGAEHTAQGEF